MKRATSRVCVVYLARCDWKWRRKLLFLSTFFFLLRKKV
jgi:hypothetical protein